MEEPKKGVMKADNNAIRSAVRFIVSLCVGFDVSSMISFERLVFQMCVETN